MIPNSNNLIIELGFILQTFLLVVSYLNQISLNLIQVGLCNVIVRLLMNCINIIFLPISSISFSPSSPLLSNHLTLPLLISSFSYNSGPLGLVLYILSQKDEAKISKRNISVQLNDLLTFFFFQPGNFCSFILYCWYQD